MQVVSGPNLAVQIQEAQDDPAIDSVKLEGGGSFDRPFILKKHTIFDSSVYACDATDEHGIIPDQSVANYGSMLIADGVLVEGTWRPPKALDDYFKFGNGADHQDPYLLAVQNLTAEELAGEGTTILEPDYVHGPYPSIEVFQALGDSHSSHTSSAHDIAVIGFHIKGRQKTSDGGVRSSILFGNCHRALAMNNYLEDTGSIGITFGGSALEHDNFANDVVATRNVCSGVGAANIATINTENSYVFENYIRRPGHHDPKFGGGVCGYDHETNSPADHTKNNWVYNNLFDYEDAFQDSAGNAICAQDPYVGQKKTENDFYIVNNVCIGGRGAGSDRFRRYMSNGIFLVGLNKFTVANNYVFRTGQNAIQAYNLSNGLFQDNLFDSTGGGGASTFWSEGMRDSVIRRNAYISRENLEINIQAGFVEICGTGNVYEGNDGPGDATNAQPERRCP